MEVEAIVKITTDIKVYTEDVLNSDTIGDYKDSLDACISNDLCQHLADRLGNFNEIEILSTKPIESGLDEYNNLLSNWFIEYNQRIKEYEELRI